MHPLLALVFEIHRVFSVCSKVQAHVAVRRVPLPNKLVPRACAPFHAGKEQGDKNGDDGSSKGGSDFYGAGDAHV